MPLTTAPSAPGAGRSGRLLTRKRLLFVIVLAGLVFGTVRIVHGSSPKKKSHQGVANSVACAKSKTKSCPRGGTKGKGHPASGQVAAGHVRHSAVHVYAVGLNPVLSRTRTAFDQAAVQASSTGLDSLSDVCSNYGTEVSLLEAQADGVPHAGPWYRPVSHLHHSLLGLFHDMLGALTDCVTAAGNTDGGSAATAEADMASAAQSMRNMDDYVRWLSHRA